MQPQNGRWDGTLSRGKEEPIGIILFLEAERGSVTGHFTVAAPDNWRGPREGRLIGRYTGFGSILLETTEEYNGVSASFLGSFSGGPDASAMEGNVMFTSEGRTSVQGTLALVFRPEIDQAMSIVW